MALIKPQEKIITERITVPFDVRLLRRLDEYCKRNGDGYERNYVIVAAVELVLDREDKERGAKPAKKNGNGHAS